ncbi:tyrosine-protein phosphatase [Campylobacter showae]|uniref:tyrosine-protein phosphatase n=1 Tax=Campylobacter showae TaxID=204 RepID=UPI001F135D0E|nr:tyrosine-protein phosphatase [Campylobacter showae]
MGINFSSQTSRFKARSKPAQIVDVLRTIRERQKEGAVLVHCYHGADRTGLVAAKVANLNFSDAKIKFDDGIVCVSEARTENFQEALK